MKISSILGLNSRSALYTFRYNSKEGKRIARSKIQTARVLRKADIPLPKLFAKFKTPTDIFNFNWNDLPDAFALKPSKGLGGEGIIVVKKRSNTSTSTESVWLTTQKKRIGIEDLKLHTLDILEGAYSIGNAPDVAFVQEYVGRHKTFRKYAYRGTPDIRIIVFNKVPVMAMLRLPTKESGGRANLHQGAVGVGIDIATGITTKAVHYASLVQYKPGTVRKLNGIKIPFWDDILKIAVRCQEVSHLGYLGVDIVLHPEKGPMVLEINSQPGLQIQLANMAGLRRRLDRVDEMEVRDAEHGVKIAQALFGERFSSKVKPKEGNKTISVWEEIKIYTPRHVKEKILAKIDTGAWRTSIDKDLASKLGLLTPENILWTRKVRTAVGREERYVINITYMLAGKKIASSASVSTRKHLRTSIIIGRKDLVGFLVSPKVEGKKVEWVPDMWNR